ncbi:MAG: hypothetical protein ACLGIB_06570 [Actinomycetota bacterium]
MSTYQTCVQKMREERGDVAQWTLVLLMSAALVIGVWTVASERLIEIVSTALSNVCGGMGC